jgi:hypothetical protein
VWTDSHGFFITWLVFCSELFFIAHT